MRESRTYGSVRGGHRKVLVYSIDELISVEKKAANSDLQRRIL